jgi:hypothetical protein
LTAGAWCFGRLSQVELSFPYMCELRGCLW